MNGRRALATAAAVAALAIGPPTALADASFDPSIHGQANTTGSVDVLPVVLAVLGGLALILLLRLRGPGAVLTLIVTGTGLAFGALFIAAGFFGDLSGQHQVFPIPILIGIGIIAAVAISLWRRRRARRLAAPTSPVEEHLVA